MREKHNIITNITVIKKAVIFAELLVLFLVIISSIAMAYTGFSEGKKPISLLSDHKFIRKDDINQTKFSTKVGLAPENPKFTEYKNRKLICKTTQSPNGHKSGLFPSL